MLRCISSDYSPTFSSYSSRLVFSKFPVLGLLMTSFLCLTYVLKHEEQSQQMPPVTVVLWHHPPLLIRWTFRSQGSTNISDSWFLICSLAHCIIAFASLLKLSWQLLAIMSLLPNSIHKFQPLSSYWRHELVLLPLVVFFFFLTWPSWKLSYFSDYSFLTFFTKFWKVGLFHGSVMEQFLVYSKYTAWERISASQPLIIP